MKVGYTRRIIFEAGKFGSLQAVAFAVCCQGVSTTIEWRVQRETHLTYLVAPLSFAYADVMKMIYFGVNL